MKRSVTAPKNTKILSDSPSDSDRAGAILLDGGLVAFPTETVYGLGADARNGLAVASVYEAKGRPSFNPLIVHVPSIEAARALVEVSDVAERLASAFWPGALTLVLPLKAESGISKLVTAGLETLAIRVPSHALAQDLLMRAGVPVAAPSANPSGRVSPTQAQHVIAGLDGKIDAVVDGGRCTVGIESTIISLAGDPTLLRTGGIPVEAIEACICAPLTRQEHAETPSAPGQLASHYAPKGTVRLNADTVEGGETLLGFGPVDAEINLSPSGDLIEAAANLFQCLHQLDQMGAEHIAVSPIPTHDLGAAINDRLNRAAAPRD
ncbi:L-threonylcarbamoyladenylate synthase [Cognatiyoonia sp.]|uniref:L-threonylcarbamoyladenylate synthase n=1 Tax=Cognatiyoonia sp. TaxID=2211652 RepID=UPI003F69A199